MLIESIELNFVGLYFIIAFELTEDMLIKVDPSFSDVFNGTKDRINDIDNYSIGRRRDIS